MKLLYAVQATGNGHITRARALLPALQQAGISVDFLFSGRPRERLFDMQCFGDFQHRTGFTFVTREGRVRGWETCKTARISEFIADVRSLDLSDYDLLLNDFEPVSAWAARRQKLPSLGLAHQYALRYPLPGITHAFWLKPAMDLFTPLDRYLGVHWQSFGQAILPPLLSLSGQSTATAIEPAPFVLVYLPFESTEQVISWLQPLSEQPFRIYADVSEAMQYGHIDVRPLCRQAFPEDLKRSQGVICNTGFGLCSEALLLGKKLLTKPLKGQIEQYSNACILQQMQRAEVMYEFDLGRVRDWLGGPESEPVCYPDVARSIAEWLVSGQDRQGEQLVRRVWEAVRTGQR